MSTIIDDSAVIKTLIDLEKGLTGIEHRRAVNRAARKGANLLKEHLRSMIPEGNKPYEHLNILKRSIKVFSSKAYKLYPGAHVTIKGPDVPVGRGSNRRFWELADYAYLVLFGNYMTPKRPTKRGGKEKGNVKGIEKGNIFRVVQDKYGTKAIGIFMIELGKEIEKEIAKRAIK